MVSPHTLPRTRQRKVYPTGRPSIAVGISIRDRGEERVRSCLKGLCHQTERPAAVLVIEQSLTKSRIGSVCRDLGVEYLRVTDPGGPFNKSLLINAALRWASTRATHFLQLDVDAILLPDVMSHLAELARRTPHKMLAVRPRRLPKMAKPYYRVPLEQLVASSKDRGDEHSWGMCLLHSIEAAFAIDGWDESFVGWGSEDVNYMLRAKKYAGAEMVDLGEVALHQWHPEASRGFAKKNRRKASQPNSNGPMWGTLPPPLQFVPSGGLRLEEW